MATCTTCGDFPCYSSDNTWQVLKKISCLFYSENLFVLDIGTCVKDIFLASTGQAKVIVSLLWLASTASCIIPISWTSGQNMLELTQVYSVIYVAMLMCVMKIVTVGLAVKSILCSPFQCKVQLL